MAIAIFAIEKIMEKSEKLILGKDHEWSLKYDIVQVWFLKAYADVNVLFSWIKVNICKVTYTNSTDNSMVKRAKIFTLESIIRLVKGIWYVFFSCSIVHLLIAIYVMYAYCFQMFRGYWEDFYEFIKINGFTISATIDLFEFISIIIVVGYIVFDIKYKSIGYFEVRTERFKDLFQMEEKLLNILININYALERNIEVIVDEKLYILQEGASKLTGKTCDIFDNQIKFGDKKCWNNAHCEDKYFQLQNLLEMKEEFDRLAELNEEFKNSSLSYSNIFLLDHKAMLTKLSHFYFPGYENFEYKKIKLFCKSSMEKWYDNRFIKPTAYSESQAKRAVLAASADLDYELMEAFKLEVYLKRYEKRMIRRFKKINNFSKLNFK